MGLRSRRSTAEARQGIQPTPCPPHCRLVRLRGCGPSACQEPMGNAEALGPRADLPKCPRLSPPLLRQNSSS